MMNEDAAGDSAKAASSSRLGGHTIATISEMVEAQLKGDAVGREGDGHGTMETCRALVGLHPAPPADATGMMVRDIAASNAEQNNHPAPLATRRRSARGKTVGGAVASTGPTPQSGGSCARNRSGASRGRGCKRKTLTE